MLTRKEIAEYLQVHPITVDRLVKRGMPSLKFGGSIRFDLEDVKDWAKKQAEEAEKEKKGE